MYTRQKDIAKKTGFSINTISLALRGSNRISDDTREKILETAKDLNYIPNDVAVSLVKRKTMTIGVVLTDVTNPILTKTAQQIEQCLAENGYTMILMTTRGNPVNEAKAIDLLIARRVDGILMYPVLPVNLEKIASLRKRNHPIILLSFGDYTAPVDAVYIDKTMGAFKATEHFIKLGHKEIAFIKGGVSEDSEKLKGYKTALEKNGLEFNPDLVMTPKGFGVEHGYDTTEKIFEKKRPTAIFASMDYLALGAIFWCKQNGLLVPDDVAVIGSDDIEAARFAEVPLTTVNYPVSEVTQKATEILFNLISSDEKLNSVQPQKIVIEPSLVIRKSCGAKPK